MLLELNKSHIKSGKTNQITGSKSESNRLLLLQSLFSDIEIKNLSNSDDSNLMQKALSSNSDLIDIHHAGTAMRFLTAYFAVQNNRTVTLTGSSRMKERPIKILVDALRGLGADITYLENQGYPPLLIKGNNLNKNTVTLKANVSSQYISALLLIAPKLDKGLKLNLDGKITSIPYIKMTLALLEQIGVETSFQANTIVVKPLQKTLNKTDLIVESDWSSASYFYSIIALSDLEAHITLSAYKEHSLQGDASLAEIYKQFGVETHFENNTITLTKSQAIQIQLSLIYPILQI